MYPSHRPEPGAHRPPASRPRARTPHRAPHHRPPRRERYPDASPTAAFRPCPEIEPGTMPVKVAGEWCRLRVVSPGTVTVITHPDGRTYQQVAEWEYHGCTCPEFADDGLHCAHIDALLKLGVFADPDVVTLGPGPGGGS